MLDDIPVGFPTYPPQFTGDQGYDIGICGCDYPYIGGRRMGTPDCCERCGFMTPEQWAYIVEKVTAKQPVRDYGYTPATPAHHNCMIEGGGQRDK